MSLSSKQLLYVRAAYTALIISRGNPKFEVLCQIIAYLHIPADRIFHPDTATDGVKKQKLLLMLQECDEQEAAEILPAIEYLLALIHKRGNSNE